MLRRAGLSRLRDLVPAEPIKRYEYREPGGLIHLYIKKLVRFERVGHRITPSRRLKTIACRATGDRTGQSNGRGWAGVEPWSATGPRTMARVHICIDDASRIAVTGSFPDEKAVSAIAALRAAVAYWSVPRSIGIRHSL